MGRARRLEGRIRCARRGVRGQSDLHRLLPCQSAPGRQRLKKGELEEGIGRSRGGRTSKVHVAVDNQGRPLRIEVTGGHVHDSQVMDVFLDWKEPPLAMVLDKAYGSAKIRRDMNRPGFTGE